MPGPQKREPSYKKKMAFHKPPDTPQSILTQTGKVVLGVDEAGRGAAVGPLTMAAAVTHPYQIATLRSKGVRDSKVIKSRWIREGLAVDLMKMCTYSEHIITSAGVDKYVYKQELNVLEREIASWCIEQIIVNYGVPVDIIALDGHALFDPLQLRLEKKYPHITTVVVDKAESKFTAVAAASVIAKHLRDTEIERIMGTKPVKGGGYPTSGSPGRGSKKWKRR